MVVLGSVLTVSYFSSPRTTLDLIGELVGQSNRFVIDELRDHLDPVIDQADRTADLLATGPFDLTNDHKVGNFLLGALAATPQVTALAYIPTDKMVIREGQDRAGPGVSYISLGIVLPTTNPRTSIRIRRAPQTGWQRVSA